MKKFLSRLAICLTLGLMTLSQTNKALAQVNVNFDDFQSDITAVKEPSNLIKNVITIIFLIITPILFLGLIMGIIGIFTLFTAHNNKEKKLEKD